MAEYQTRFDGEPADRIGSWKSTLMGIMREEPLVSSLTVWYKRCGAKMLTQDPKWRQAFGKLHAFAAECSVDEFKDTAVNVVQVLLSDQNAPAWDTIPRQSREAKAALGIKERDFAANLAGQTIDGILREIEGRLHSYGSDLEVKLGYAIKEHLPGGDWKINERQNGVYAEPDIISHVYRISIEVDSWTYHRQKDKFLSDRRKSRRVQLKGYRHLQFAGEELTIRNGITRVVSEVSKFVAPT